MGQIANQMLIDAIGRLKQKLKNRQAAKNNENNASKNGKGKSKSR